MTEIQFLVDLLMNHALDEDVRKLCLTRIVDVEKKASPAPLPMVHHSHPAPYLPAPTTLSPIPLPPPQQDLFIPKASKQKASEHPPLDFEKALTGAKR